MNKIYRGRPIGNVGFNSPVDIVCTFHGQYQKVTRLVESIFRCTKSNPYNIYLVDDCSPNKEYLLYDPITKSPIEIEGLKLIRTPEQLGFGGALFHGFKETTAPWVVFINSDCAIEDLGWLKNMGTSLKTLKDQGVRMISPLSNNSCGHDYQQMSKEKYMSSEHKIDVILDINKKEYLSFYCVMCHRDLFAKCGGFIRDYPFGWYEDMEFAYRMNKNGYKQAVCHSSWIYHEGEATIKDVWRKNPESREIMEIDNYEKCVGDIKKLFSK